MAKAMSKYELAAKAGVQWRVMHSWIIADIAELEKMGYRKKINLLNPAIVNFLCEKYCIDL